MTLPADRWYFAYTIRSDRLDEGKAGVRTSLSYVMGAGDWSAVDSGIRGEDKMTRDIDTFGNGCAGLGKCAKDWSPRRFACLAIVLALATGDSLAGDDAALNGSVPDEVKQIFAKPRYDKAIWGLRVVDLSSGDVLYDLNSDRHLLIGSVRKLFSVGLALEGLGGAHVFRTPVFAQGRKIHHGRVLDGDLVLVASGDLTMGGRTTADGKY